MEASNDFHEDWVLNLADSLETFSKTTGQKEFSYYATELRCHNAFNKRDREKFLKYSQEARDMAKKNGYVEKYFNEMMNTVSFFINTKEYTEAEITAKQILTDGKKMKYNKAQFWC